MSNIKHIIEGNWQEIKGKIQSNWAKLTDDDIEAINGSYKKLTGKLQKLYGYKMEDVEDEISEFLDSGNFQALIEKSENKIREINDIVLSTLNDYFSAAKRKSQNAEKKVATCLSENPYKALGIAATAGILIGFLFRQRSE